MNIIGDFKQPKKNIKTAKRRKASSTRWLERQLNDPYVTLAKQKGYRCRAAFKILEIDEKFKIFKKGQKVLDLGCAPGGWSQVVCNKVGANNILALDILPVQSITGVKTIQQDFLEKDAEKIILKEMKGEKYDVVMSDMAANTTGNKNIDHIRTSALVEEAFNFSLKILKKGGTFIAKVFQGGTEPELFQKMKENFTKVKHFKPNSSRKESVEMYVIAQGFKDN
ncbi:MAG TPA: RlmE family RNA methyltransferase [Rickettsiales bacterium]|nr:RlmE family RNA methyltransferase [Rickettsiales bacterium]